MNSELVTMIPRLTDYFGVWAMHEPILTATVDRVSRMDLIAHVNQSRAAGAGSEGADTYRVNMTADGVAVVDVSGTLMKGETSLTNSTSSVRMRRTLRALAGDPAVKAVMLRIDSPGGTVAGTQDLADEISALGAVKPVASYIEDLGASAAYWIASQTSRIDANATAMVGSIGTYAVIQDASGMAGQLGIKVHVVKAGEFKGAGTPGTAVTDAQLAEWQRLVTDHNSHFLAAVGKGRNMTALRVSQLADGRVHLANAAHAMGLIDGVSSFDTALQNLTRRIGTTAGSGRGINATHTMENDMADDKTPAPVATPPAVAPKIEPAAVDPRAQFNAELKRYMADFGDVNGAKWFGEGKTHSEAQTAYIGVLKADLATAISNLEAANQKLKAVNRGLPAVATFQEDEGKGKSKAEEYEALKKTNPAEATKFFRENKAALVSEGRNGK